MIGKWGNRGTEKRPNYRKVWFLQRREMGQIMSSGSRLGVIFLQGYLAVSGYTLDCYKWGCGEYSYE